jgi:hypothetical protein
MVITTGCPQIMDTFVVLVAVCGTAAVVAEAKRDYN